MTRTFEQGFARMMNADPTSLSRTPVQVRIWSYEEWLAGEKAWTDLLARSTSDQLFLSWHWLTEWWRSFGPMTGGELLILAAYRASTLVGLLPLYVAPKTHGRVLKVRSLQFVGSSWRDDGVLNSSYAEAIASREDLGEVRSAFAEVLLAKSWTEFVVGFTDDAQSWIDCLAQSAVQGSRFARVIERSVSYQLDLSAGLSAYQSRLGQSTRRSVFNLRRRLHELGEVSLEEVGVDGIESAFVDMNRLHLRRWKKPAYAGPRLEFHERMAKTLAQRGELAMTRLHLRGEVISVIYDVRRAATQYNLKLGFDPALERSFSLGLLHLGFAIEAAANSGIKTYDLLAGPGRVRDFKQNLAQRKRELATLHLVRGPVLSRLFRWNQSRRQRNATKGDQSIMSNESQDVG